MEGVPAISIQPNGDYLGKRKREYVIKLRVEGEKVYLVPDPEEENGLESTEPKREENKPLIASKPKPRILGSSSDKPRLPLERPEKPQPAAPAYPDPSSPGWPDALLSKVPKKLPTRPGGNLIREDYTKVTLSDFDRVRLAYSSALSFNRRIVEERANTQLLVAEQAALNSMERYSVENLNTVFQSHQIPVVIQLADGRAFVDPNDCIAAIHDTVEKFIDLNVQNENNKHFQDSRYLGAYHPTVGRGQRRRRRGTLKKLK